MNPHGMQSSKKYGLCKRIEYGKKWMVKNGKYKRLEMGNNWESYRFSSPASPSPQPMILKRTETRIPIEYMYLDKIAYGLNNQGRHFQAKILTIGDSSASLTQCISLKVRYEQMNQEQI